MEWLTELGIVADNPGACLGPQWLAGEYQFASINPATGDEIATAGACSRSDYERVIAHAAHSADHWRMVPAPKRGELIWRIGTELRHRKAALGNLSVFSLMLSNDNALAEQFVRDPRFALVSFTGSSAVGSHVAEVVARRMGRYLLECSGNNAIIVDDSADLELAVPAIVFGAIGTAGQRCTTTRRLIVHEARYDQLVKRLIDAYRVESLHAPPDGNHQLGPRSAVRARHQV